MKNNRTKAQRGLRQGKQAEKANISILMNGNFIEFGSAAQSYSNCTGRTDQLKYSVNSTVGNLKTKSIPLLQVDRKSALAA